MTASNLTYVRLDDTRLLTPYALRPLDLWVILRLWPDAEDQKVLMGAQLQIRQSRKQIEFTEQHVERVRDHESMGLVTLMRRDQLRRQYNARYHFAVAALETSKLFPLANRPYDLLAVYARFVSQMFSTEEGRLLYGDPGYWPVVTTSYIGGVMLDNVLLELDKAGVPYDAGARKAAREVYRAIIVNFHQDECDQWPA